VTPHLGADLAALVDGELDHASRERVLRHLSRCAGCRAEVEEQRHFKARLLGLGDTAPVPAPDLAARLRELSFADDLPLAGDLRRTGKVIGSGPRVRRRPPTSPRTGRGSRGPRGGRRTAPRTAVGGAVLALGLGVVLILGAPHREPTRAPVDPTSDTFLSDYASTSGELPLPEPAGVTSAGLAR